MLCVSVLAACTPAQRPTPDDTTTPSPSTIPRPPTSAAAQQVADPLFYSKDGRIWVSNPVGAPPAPVTADAVDTEPAPSPDAAQVAFIRSVAAGDTAGELWVSPVAEPAPRRLVDPAVLPPGQPGTVTALRSPQWSPDGTRVAALARTAPTTTVLVVFDVATGAPVPTGDPRPVRTFAWSPDGALIGWVQQTDDDARGRPTPREVGTLSLADAQWRLLAGATAATGVAFAADGQSVLFANDDAALPDLLDVGFQVRPGGLYRVALDVSLIEPVVTAPNTRFDDPAGIGASEFAYTQQPALDRAVPKSLHLLSTTALRSNESIGGVSAVAPGPRWARSGIAAWIAEIADDETAPLLVGRPGGNQPRRIDTGVHSFGWPLGQATGAAAPDPR